jgi:phosphate/sulfate permease
MDVYLVAVIILAGLAISDLIVGVSNDAVNFLNSSIGSRVAPRHVIMIIAGLGILAGVTFSSGMMEVARKGIFHPEFFTMPEIMVIFLAVMLTDILLLDLFNTFGLPTSTTVSIVFELLGAAVAVSLIKINAIGSSFSSLVNYINTAKALAIVSGILLSIVIAFFFGALVQFLSRLIFTFDYQKRLKRYGAIWGGLALSMIIYFILIKGSKGASFMSPNMVNWIMTHTWFILLGSFLISSVVLQVLMILSDINILKPIVLIGTFALAMAFAANDLVNFIGVPLAGLSAYSIANATSNPLSVYMKALQGPVHTNTLLLLLAGVIMTVTLWISRKARTVTKTEIDLGRQDDGLERFDSSPFSRVSVRMVSSLFEKINMIIPEAVQHKISKRLNPEHYDTNPIGEGKIPSFDLVRASVNLMVASAVISFATSLKLPLSTTYVTFMVAMGSSLSDQAWGRESAVYRVTGVLTVIGGWFFTAFMAFTISLIFALAIYYFRLPAILLILGLSIVVIWRNHHIHKGREKEDDAIEVFNLKKIKDPIFAINTSFEHTSHFLQLIKETLDICFEGLFNEDRQMLKFTRSETKKIQRWANIIIANIFKTLRLLEQEDIKHTRKYAQTISSLQEIAESHRDIIMKAYLHVDNHHKGLLDVQIEELKQIKVCIIELLDKTSKALLKGEMIDPSSILEINQKLKRLEKQLDRNQIKRIQDDTSKTRLSILFYGVMWDSRKIVESTLNLLKVFQDSFKINGDS